MTALMTEAEAELWLDSPIVRHVSRHYSPADTLELLEGVHLYCTELEDKFPGVPFRQILSSHESPSPWPTLRTLARTGTSPESLAVVFGRFEFRKEPTVEGSRSRFDTVTPEFLSDIQRLGASRTALSDAGYGQTASDNMHFAHMASLSDADLRLIWGGDKRIRERHQKQDMWDEIVRLVICEDETLTAVAERFASSPATISKICIAFLYQLWVATEGRLP